MIICCKHANAWGLISCEVCLSSTSKDQNTKTDRKSKVSAFIVIVKRHLLACHSGGIEVVHWWNNYGVCPPIAVIITIVVMRMDCCTFSPLLLFLKFLIFISSFYICVSTLPGFLYFGFKFALVCIVYLMLLNLRIEGPVPLILGGCYRIHQWPKWLSWISHTSLKYVGGVDNLQSSCDP